MAEDPDEHIKAQARYVVSSRVGLSDRLLIAIAECWRRCWSQLRHYAVRTSADEPS